MTRRAAWLLVAWAGCGPPAMQPRAGVATVQVTPGGVTMGELTLATASLRLGHIVVFGNVPPPMGMMMPIELVVNALGAGDQVKIPMLPQGVYSRVQFGLEMTSVSGTWRGTPFTAVILPPPRMMPPVDLRSPNGQELGPEMDISFAVAVDVGSWFANNLLDQATAMGGKIVCDGMSNMNVTIQLTGRVHDSFSLQ